MQRKQVQAHDQAAPSPVQRAGMPPREVRAETWEIEGVVRDAGTAKQDAFGRTLDEGLAEDRRQRARILRRARKVGKRIRACDAVARSSATLARRSWDPLTWLINNLVPRSFTAFAGMALLFCCGCGLPLLHLVAGMAAIFLGLGVVGTAGGGLTWLVVVAFRKLLSWYLKWLVPW